ncbi:hypothetical protein [Rubritalea tangerina]
MCVDCTVLYSESYTKLHFKRDRMMHFLWLDVLRDSKANEARALCL